MELVENRLCTDWREITTCLSDFSAPGWEFNSETGQMVTKAWVFRGLKDASYKLEPTIERAAQDKGLNWSAMEELVLSEFKARARSYLKAPLIPNDTDKFTWLAEMQHYGIPTRLLDFTYSPFVALYFAVRHEAPPHFTRLTPIEKKKLGVLLEKAGAKPPRTHVQLWAVDASAVNRRFREVVSDADHRFYPVNMDAVSSQRDSVIDETQGLHALIAERLSAADKIDITEIEINREGCICAAPPPAFNPRLVSQQGLFLINCAERPSFWESLTKMMRGCRGWGKTFNIPVDSILDIERRLLQMNIHEQSLFPDMEGLANLIQQKIRLQWK